MPRGYAWLMTAATVPAITLLLFLIGGVSRGVVKLGELLGKRPKEGDRQSTDLLWAIGLGVQYAPWLLSTNTPIFGNTIEAPIATQPPRPASEPPIRTDVKCEDNALPNLNGSAATPGAPMPVPVTP